MLSVSSAEKPRKADMLANFLEAIDAAEDGTCHGVVHKGPTGAPNDHYWPTGADHVAQLAAHVSGYEAYVTVGAYRRADVGRFNGRKAANVTKLKALVLDIDAGPEKHRKHPETTYADGDSSWKAVKAFISAAGFKPNFVTNTLSGGLHLWFVLDEALTVSQWLPLAKGLVALCERHGLKIDAQCTTDAARIMRAPGSMRDGAEVIGHRGRDKPYTTEEMAGLLGPDLDAVSEPVGLNAGTARSVRGINADVLEDSAPVPYSYMQAAEKCGAMASAMQRGGRDVTYPVWLLALATAKHAIEGEVFAHQISEGHDDYDEAETDAKLRGLNGGPPGCEAWAEACGPSGPCSRCKFKGQLKNPAVQLGKVVAATPAVVAEGDPAGAVHIAFPDRRVNADGDKTGAPLNTTDNLEALTRMEGVSARLNLMTHRTELTVPGLKAATDNADNTGLAVLGDMAVRRGLRREGLPQLVDAVATRHPYHPVVETLKAHPWDGTDRLPMFHRSLTLRDPSSAVLSYKLLDAFVMQGVKAWHSERGFASQGMLVLAGPQGIGKTRWTQALVPVDGAVRTGLNLDPTNKDSVLRATSCAVAELGELDATFRRADIAGLKAFLTADQDVLRLPYALRESTFPRRTVFVGTVNGANFLYDDTGNRRFWTVSVTKCTPMPEEDMVQVLAQYKHMLDAGALPYLDTATQAQLNESNKEHEAIDPLRERILSVFDWSVVQRPGWLYLPGVTWGTATDVCRHHLGIYEPTTAQATKIGAIVGSLNGGQRQRSNGLRTMALPPRRGQ